MLLRDSLGEQARVHLRTVVDAGPRANRRLTDLSLVEILGVVDWPLLKIEVLTLLQGSTSVAGVGLPRMGLLHCLLCHLHLQHASSQSALELTLVVGSSPLVNFIAGRHILSVVQLRKVNPLLVISAHLRVLALLKRVSSRVVEGRDRDAWVGVPSREVAVHALSIF